MTQEIFNSITATDFDVKFTSDGNSLVIQLERVAAGGIIATATLHDGKEICIFEDLKAGHDCIYQVSVPKGVIVDIKSTTKINNYYVN